MCEGAFRYEMFSVTCKKKAGLLSVMSLWSVKLIVVNVSTSSK